MTVTLQADSGEDDIDDLFSNILNKDPMSILDRLDPDLSYPTYGDDSTLVIDAPTSGGFYLKVEKDGNFGLWGDFKSVTPGTDLLRNERTLYGAQTVLQTAGVNDDGAPRLRFEGYAPLAQGAVELHRAADAMLAVHNLSSLEQLATSLAGVMRR